MNINNLFFQLHYCNSRLPSDVLKFSNRTINRTIQHHELIFITGGKGHIILKHKRYEFKEGTLLYICPNVQYSIELDAEESLYGLAVHFSYATVGFNSDKWDIKKETDSLSLDFMQILKDYYQINNTFKKLVQVWDAKLPGYEFITKTLLQQLLFEILLNKRKNSPNYSTSLKVEKIIEYMQHN